MTKGKTTKKGGEFTRMFVARWADMDFNAHMRNTAFLELAGDVRMMFFQENGFAPGDFEKQRIGPVILRDELEYHREIRLLETVLVTLSMAGCSKDGSRFCIRNEFFKEDGTPVARVTSTGGWMDLDDRKIKPPPEALAAAQDRLARTSDFEVITARSRKG